MMFLPWHQCGDLLLDGDHRAAKRVTDTPERGDETMPRYLIRFDDGRSSEPFDAIGPREAAEYAMECLLDDGAEPGEEASVFVLDEGGRGDEELVATVAVPGEDDE